MQKKRGQGGAASTGGGISLQCVERTSPESISTRQLMKDMSVLPTVVDSKQSSCCYQNP